MASKPKPPVENKNPESIPIYCAYDELLPIEQLKPNPKNNNIHPDEQIKLLAKLIENHGWRLPITVSNLSGCIVRGHGKLMAARLLGADVVPVDFQDYKDYAQELADLMADNKIPELSLFDDDLTRELLSEIKELDADFDMELTGFSDEELNVIFDLDDPTGPIEGEDDIPEPPAEPKSKLGDLYQLGRHRLLCGDSTKREDVERLMGGEKAELIHADPPYGMGKEKDGILNDNLYREKLDAFQMSWWNEYRLFLNDNASAYIWGNAEDLWRLWYCGGLRDSERLTFRNEIIWNKKNGQGINSEDFRSYAPVTERCLFFMLGEQGFNNNADNYWEGWEPIRDYLYQEAKKIGINNSKAYNTVLGLKTSGGGMYAHHISPTGSQFMFITREHYQTLQQAANGKAFKREYDELKREFYKTRAYFDNTHEDMTDVWEFDRVIGEERFGHASPKSVKMVIRSIKSSSHEESNVIDPFGGTGPALIACEKINRRCFVMELSPVWIDVIIQRWETFTGQKAVKL